MLEDDGERLQRFTAVLRSLAPDLPVHVWRDAYLMIREAGPLLPATAAISLDHDLVAEPGGADPGDGYMVTQWLTAQSIKRPVIIHTSNVERASWMAGEFDLAGWLHHRVLPFGDDWIESDWRQVIEPLIGRGQVR